MKEAPAGKPATAKGWINQGHNKELLAAGAVVVALALYERSKSSSASSTPSTATTTATPASYAGGGTGGMSQLSQEIEALDLEIQAMQANPNPLAGGAPAQPSPSPSAPYVPASPSGSAPSTPVASTGSPYTSLQIAQNSPGTAELPLQAANNAAWAKGYAADTAPATKVSSSPYAVGSGGVPMLKAGMNDSGGVVAHKATPVSVVKKAAPAAAPATPVPGRFVYVNGHRYFS